MKMSCWEWTLVQIELPADDVGNQLWQLIETRTFGKPYQSQIAIALSKQDEALVQSLRAPRRAKDVEDRS